MPLDPQAKALLSKPPPWHAMPVSEMTAEKLRAMGAPPSTPTMVHVHKIEDRHIPGPRGNLRIRIFTPEGPGPFPVVMWFHGGGWVLGTIEATESPPRHLANAAHVATISVEYGLAPEHKFPEGLEDCYAALEWVCKHGKEINVDASRIAVAGESAGGNLAAAISLMARDRKGPSISFQLLVYPITEMTFDTKSHKENAEGYLMRRDMMEWYRKQYLHTSADAENPYAAPMKAASLRGLPPAMILTAQYDPYRDDGAKYAKRLIDEFVPVTYICYEGMMHGFFGKPQTLDKAQLAVNHASDALKTALKMR